MAGIRVTRRHILLAGLAALLILTGVSNLLSSPLARANLVVVTPAFTPGPGCTSTPSTGVVSGVISAGTTTTSALFTNYSTTCSYPIGLAAYNEPDALPADQTLFDYALAVIPPNSSLTLTVNNPPCGAIVYAFYGSDVLQPPNADGYGTRTLDSVELCPPSTATSTSTSTPTPTLTPLPLPDKVACKNGGYRNYIDPRTGQPFRNEGQCVNVAAHA